MSTSRRQFLMIAAAVCGGGALLGATGCGDSGTGTDSGTPHDSGGGGSCTTPATTIALNHGHAMSVSLGDVTADASKTYDIMGTALHTHSVTVSPAQFTSLSHGTSVMIVSGPSSGGDGHTHTVTVSCS